MLTAVFGDRPNAQGLDSPLLLLSSLRSGMSYKVALPREPQTALFLVRLGLWSRRLGEQLVCFCWS